MLEKLDKNVVQDLLTVRDWIRWSASRMEEAGCYFGHGTDNAWDEAVQLVMWAVLMPWDKLNQIADARLTLMEREALFELIKCRIEDRIPAPYLTGKAYFMGLEFQITPDVLIPRSPIAELIEAEFQPWVSQEPQRILDLCTGSGCIGIACALAFPDAEVDLSDISESAIAIAQQNIDHYELADRVRAVRADLFEGITETYDVIVTNPPYVDAQDMADLPAEYRVEPSLALESGDDGLDFTRRLLAQAGARLNPGGTLICEVGNSAPALEEAFPEVPFVWLEFERGGQGVFMLSQKQLLALAAELN